MKAKGEIQGCFYQRNGRWYWRVKLPDQNKAKSFPLKPIDSKFATTDREVAEEVAKQIWQQAIFSSAKASGCPANIEQLVSRYLAYAKSFYRPPSKEHENIRYGLTPLVTAYGKLPVADFGPLKLKEVRQQMIKYGWARPVVNKRVSMIKRMFRWAVSEQMIAAATFQALAAVEGLRRGRCGAYEPEPVKPVAENHVHKILPFTTDTVAAMIRLQLLTGMRSSELCYLRPTDIETSGKIWLYRPKSHKTSYRGHDRTIAIGPKAQAVLRPFLKRTLTNYCFSPTESNAQRGKQQSKTNNSYNRTSYRRAVEYAIIAARKAGVDVPDFCPHQLRHTAATKIRKALGLDAARAALGHRNMKVTDEYAELDKSLAKQAALECG